MVSAALLVATSMVVGQVEGEDAFKSWADYSVGGVWTSTMNGVKSEISYKRTLNGRFLQAELKSGDTPVTFLVGVDPVTKKCTRWRFDGDGFVVKWVMSRASENDWTSQGKGMGPKGECALKEKVTRIDADTVKEEIEYFMLNGTEQKAGTAIWTRKRGPFHG